MGSRNPTLVALLLLAGASVGCSSGGSRTACAQRKPWPARAPLLPLALTAHDVKGTSQEEGDAPMVNSVDLYDEQPQSFVAILNSTLMQPSQTVFSDMSARRGGANGGLSITSGVIRARSAAAANRLAQRGALPLVRFNGFFRGVPSRHAGPPSCLGDHVVALTSDELRGAQGEAALWTRGDLVELLIVVDQRSELPAARLATLAHRQDSRLAAPT